MPQISPLAVVEPGAVLADNVEVGPFCLVGAHVTLGAGCRLLSHAVITGHTIVGQRNMFFPNCVVGADPQDKKYRGAPTRVIIGDNNIIREAATIHAGTEKGGMITRLGSNNLIMVNCHVGHDAQIGNNCVLANNVMIAGHVHIGDFVNIMGAVGVHHFVTIGDYAYISAASRIHHDVPPFVKVDGADQVRGLNKVGLRRAGLAETQIDALDDACRRLFFKEKPVAVAIREYDCENGVDPNVKKIIEFLRRRDQGKHGRFLESKREDLPPTK